MRITPRHGALKTLTITHKGLTQNLEGTPITLGTSKPGTATFEHTIVSGDIAAFSNPNLAYSNVAEVCLSGRSPTAATISYSLEKNAGVVASGTVAISTNYYWTLNCYADAEVGDVVSIYVWSNQTDSNYDYYYWHIIPTRIFLESAGCIIDSLWYNTMVAYYPSGVGNPVQVGGLTDKIRIGKETSVNLLASSSATEIGAVHVSPNGCTAVGYGDYSGANSVSTRNHATGHPCYQRQTFLISLRWRKVDLDR